VSDPRSTSARPARLDLIWLGLCVVVFVVLCVVLRKFVTDDAYISVRYADNLANGYGFVFNPHGPPVEGFSNPLLVGVEAVGHLVGLTTITAARALGLVSGVALLVVIALFAPRVIGRASSNIALALVAAYPPLAFWAVGGLETLPAALVVTAGVLLLAAEPTRGRAATAGAVLALLPWLRPEGLVVAVVAAAAVELRCIYVRASRREGLVRLGLAAGIPIASQILLELERLAAYGHLLPNSALYKAGKGDTFGVLGAFAAQTWPMIVLAAIGALLSRGRTRVLAVPPFVYALGALATLNQVNRFSRFLLPAWPLLALLAGVAIAAACRRVPRARVPIAAGATGALVAVGLLLLPGKLSEATGVAKRYTECEQRARTKAIRWLQRHTPPTTAYSASDVGLMASRSGTRTVVDQLGLNEPYIQTRGRLPVVERVNYVYERRPDAIVLISRKQHRLVARYGTDIAIAADPRFRRYTLAHVSRVVFACHYQLFIYRRGGGAARK
jgi:hypothetical protein